MSPTQNHNSSEGLKGHDHTALELAVPAHRWSRRRIALQLSGLVVGLGLLVWVVMLATNQRNTESIDALRAAPVGVFVALIGLSLVSVVLNGAMFWVVLRPLARISLLETIAVNAMATFLSILPFKISLLTRSLIHHRRHRLRYKIIVSWIAATGALAMTVLLPLAAAGLWRQQLDALWWITACGGVVICNCIGIVLGRAAQNQPILRTLSLGAHVIVRHPQVAIQHGALRLLDMGVLTGRFLVAASIIGMTLDPDQAVLIATTYFLLSVLTPAGTLGPREMGVAALGFVQGDGIAQQLALAALVVSLAEILSAASLSAIGAVRIKPYRILFGRPAPDGTTPKP